MPTFKNSSSVFALSDLFLSALSTIISTNYVLAMLEARVEFSKNGLVWEMLLLN